MTSFQYLGFFWSDYGHCCVDGKVKFISLWRFLGLCLSTVCLPHHADHAPHQIKEGYSQHDVVDRHGVSSISTCTNLRAKHAMHIFLLSMNCVLSTYACWNQREGSLPSVLPQLTSLIKSALRIIATQQKFPNFSFDWWMNTLTRKQVQNSENRMLQFHIMERLYSPMDLRPYMFIRLIFFIS